MEHIRGNILSRLLIVTRLGNAIFGKELRVASRRRRNYVLRFAYIFLLVIILSLIWFNVISSTGTRVYQISQQSLAGQMIVAMIVWLQFCAGQIVAGIALSTAISDEIHHSTLGLLMTTPLNSFHIVLGKLFSKLLQTLILLAISLPLLSIVRVFGGVPWDFVISSLCITVATVIFVSSISMFFSIFSRKAYLAIVHTIFTIFLLFLLVPLGVTLLIYVNKWNNQQLINTLLTLLYELNPYFLMIIKTTTLFNPGSIGLQFSTAPWYINCAVMLAASAFVLFISIIMVRRVALMQATGEVIFTTKKRKRRKSAISDNSRQIKEDSRRIRHIKCAPVIWKECLHPILGRRKILSILGIIAGASLIAYFYWLCAREDLLQERETHILYALIYMSLGLLNSIVLPATCITSEKESRAWPLLLTTTLDDWQILTGKFIGSLRRVLLAWSLLVGHMVIFTIAGLINPAALLLVGIVMLEVIVLLICSGIYFSSIYKHTTTAVIMNFAFAAGIWLLFPIIMGLISSIFRTGDSLMFCIDMNPYFQVSNILDKTAGINQRNSGFEIIANNGRMSFSGYLVLQLVIGSFYIAGGMIFLLLTKLRLRRDIFK